MSIEDGTFTLDEIANYSKQDFHYLIRALNRERQMWGKADEFPWFWIEFEDDHNESRVKAEDTILRALADLPEPLTPQQLRTASDLLESWTGTLPELLATIAEITAPRQVGA